MLKKIWIVSAVAAAGFTFAFPVGAQTQICGYYVILGCYKQPGQAYTQLNRIGGPMAGGGAGTDVIHTNEYPNFRNGWFCVADGPYASKQNAASIAWKEAVRDAYVKNGC